MSRPRFLEDVISAAPRTPETTNRCAPLRCGALRDSAVRCCAMDEGLFLVLLGQASWRLPSSRVSVATFQSCTIFDESHPGISGAAEMASDAFTHAMFSRPT